MADDETTEDATRFTHPEAEPDEIWIGNIYAVDFRLIGWRTRRLGRTPYGSDGKPLKGGNLRPVMIKRAETMRIAGHGPARGPIDHRW